MRFRTEISGKRIDEEIKDKIESGIEDATNEEKSNSIPDQAVDVAKARIDTAGAVFRGDLIDSFTVSRAKADDQWVVKIENTSDHAAPIEYGATYGAEGPPVAALIPWVKAKMSGFSVPDGDSESLPEADRIREQVDDEVNYGLDAEQLADEQTLKKAFWLQRHIKENGIDPLRYMQRAEEWIEENGSRTVAAFIRAEFR